MSNRTLPLEVVVTLAISASSVFAQQSCEGLNATNPDLRSFRAQGGKLLQYRVWGDAAISAISSIEYYDSVQTFLSKFPDARSAAGRPIADFYACSWCPE